MDVHGVDPRDMTWEQDAPSYRVSFHDAAGASDEYELSGADVEDVLAWAVRQRRGRSFVLYVHCTLDDRPGLIRLAGWDPNDAGPTPARVTR